VVAQGLVKVGRQYRSG